MRDLLCPHYVTERGRTGFKQWRGVGNCKGLLDHADLQGHVDTDAVRRAEHNIIERRRTKAGGLDGQVIFADSQHGRKVVAGSIGRHFDGL